MVALGQRITELSFMATLRLEYVLIVQVIFLALKKPSYRVQLIIFARLQSQVLL
jgi:hypothetical protein